MSSHTHELNHPPHHHDDRQKRGHPHGHQLATNTLRAIKQNLFFAFIFSSSDVPFQKASYIRAFAYGSRECLQRPP